MSVATTPAANSAGLSAALRCQTRAAHEAAETSEFVWQLTRGTLPLEAYAALVAQNHAIYTALERLGETWRHDPAAGAFVLDELRRVLPLEEDLRRLLGPRWRLRTEHLVEPATRRYAEYLAGVCDDWPAGYVAHHYVRYLGDLSGGQILRRAIERAHPSAPTAFYRFDGIGKLKPFRDSYRRLLDAMPIGIGEQRRMVTEAITAFELNRAVFDDLGARYCPDARTPPGGPPVH